MFMVFECLKILIHKSWLIARLQKVKNTLKSTELLDICSVFQFISSYIINPSNAPSQQNCQGHIHLIVLYQESKTYKPNGEGNALYKWVHILK